MTHQAIFPLNTRADGEDTSLCSSSHLGGKRDGMAESAGETLRSIPSKPVTPKAWALRLGTTHFYSRLQRHSQDFLIGQ